jgi:hypothetical protein
MFVFRIPDFSFYFFFFFGCIECNENACELAGQTFDRGKEFGPFSFFEKFLAWCGAFLSGTEKCAF